MSAIHFILNLAGLLLWMKWMGFGESSKPGTTLAPRFQNSPATRSDFVLRLFWLAALAVLLAGRGLIYWQVGTAANWTPTVSLGAIQLTFRSDLLVRMLMFSSLGFLQCLGEFYLILLLASAAIPHSLAESPILRTIRQLLWRIDRWPAWPKLLLPIPIVSAIWVALTPVLSQAHLLLPPNSMPFTVLQGVVLGLSACVFWSYVAAAVMFLFLLNSYIYFGANPFWAFVQEFGGKLVSPLASLPLRLRKADFAPVLGIGLMWCLARFVPVLLTAAFRKLQ